MSLSPADIDAIAEAVVAKLRAAEKQPASLVDEVLLAAEQGIAPLAYLKSKFQTPRQAGRRKA